MVTIFTISISVILAITYLCVKLAVTIIEEYVVLACSFSCSLECYDSTIGNAIVTEEVAIACSLVTCAVCNELLVFVVEDGIGCIICTRYKCCTSCHFLHIAEVRCQIRHTGIGTACGTNANVRAVGRCVDGSFCNSTFQISLGSVKFVKSYSTRVLGQHFVDCSAC